MTRVQGVIAGGGETGEGEEILLLRNDQGKIGLLSQISAGRLRWTIFYSPYCCRCKDLQPRYHFKTVRQCSNILLGYPICLYSVVCTPPKHMLVREWPRYLPPGSRWSLTISRHHCPSTIFLFIAWCHGPLLSWYLWSYLLLICSITATIPHHLR